jgi:hypothetical protein
VLLSPLIFALSERMGGEMPMVGVTIAVRLLSLNSFIIYLLAQARILSASKDSTAETLPPIESNILVLGSRLSDCRWKSLSNVLENSDAIFIPCDKLKICK